VPLGNMCGWGRNTPTSPVDEVREADHLLMWEVLGMVIQVGQVSSSV
jgi:hypothetical protein